MTARKVLSNLLVCAALSGLAVLAGCGGPPPVSGAVYVSTAPPPDQIEVIGVAPSGEHIWIPGHYSWDGGRYSWAAGHYELRPRTSARWVRGRWRRHQGRWYWVDGHWR